MTLCGSEKAVRLGVQPPHPPPLIYGANLLVSEILQLPQTTSLCAFAVFAKAGSRYGPLFSLCAFFEAHLMVGTYGTTGGGNIIGSEKENVI
ncbi:hypothetical protein QE152_g5193 [Popillia japonica]|uniref:Uncharacterized protein n=1 Tax=Popillia japonica TaxID=7064 RepID=A0AAW1MQ44_POPJA